MKLSYWEHKLWLQQIDYTIVGSGLVGLNCALALKKRFPKAKILVLERGILPNGASTKNAGFACFGSISEILDDLNSHSEEEVVDLVKKRLQGLKMLREQLGEKSIGYQKNGSYELFVETDQALFEDCHAKIEIINQLLFPIFKEEVFSLKRNTFKFQKVLPSYIFNKFEAQLDTAKMYDCLLQKVLEKGIKILNNIEVTSFSDLNGSVEVQTNNFSFKTNKLFMANNGFASKLGIDAVKPARAQVLITEPVENLHIKGTFHLEKGFYYFRNIDKRILLGGGRNLDIKTEETTEIAETELVQNKLEELLQNVIFPEQKVEIAHRWAGIMGVGNQKRPIVKQLSQNVYCGVRLGGMGVAIGSLVGKELADLL